MGQKSFISKGALLEGNDLEAEYRLRKVEYLTDSIPKGSPIPEGWERARDFKTKTRITKRKSLSIQLEDKIWRLFFEIGAQQISSKNFTLVLKDREGLTKTKQIDALAVDDDIVFVVECKSQETLGKRSMKQDIAEFALNLNDYRNAIRALLDNRDIKFIFIIATENIEWNENDKLDAKEHGIFAWDEYDILGLQDLAKLAGQGAKYQIYNRVFMGKKIKGFEVRVPALEARMGGHKYYSLVLSPNDLLKIAYVHHRSGSSGFLEIANSYQRMIKPSRIRNIRQFIEAGGFFPGSIIINFHKDLLRRETIADKERLEELPQNVRPVVISLPPYYGSAWIVDGQHRLYGYADLDKKYTDTLPVIAFVQEDPSMEARMFVDINENQKAIEANLLWDLYEDLYAVTQDELERQMYTISKIAKALNSRENSPFFGHISIPKEQNEGNLTLVTICGSMKQQKLIAPAEGLLFHNTYEDTVAFAANRVQCFFDVIRNNMEEEWRLGDQHYIRTNAGFTVLLGILRDIVECNIAKPELQDLNKFRTVVTKFLEPLIIHLLDATPDTIRSYRGAGGAGQKSRQVRHLLTTVLRDASIGFRSIWLEKYDEALKEEDKLGGKRKSAGFYLEKDESETLEFKGSLTLHLNRYLLGDGSRVDDQAILDEGVLKTIVAFLNSKGGDILIGILEQDKYADVYEAKLSDCPVVDKKIVFGIQPEYRKDEWDGYLQRLTDFIERRIGSDVLDSDVVRISKLSYKDKDLCLVSVSPADSKQYLNNNKFFIRRANKTVLLEGPEIDRYWSSRKC